MLPWIGWMIESVLVVAWEVIFEVELGGVSNLSWVQMYVWYLMSGKQTIYLNSVYQFIFDYLIWIWICIITIGLVLNSVEYVLVSIAFAIKFSVFVLVTFVTENI